MKKTAASFLINDLRDVGHFSKAILNAFKKIPREFFVPNKYQDQAYENHPLPIGYDQTISQPYIVARMTEILLRYCLPKNTKKFNKILEIGTGSGYQAAILSQFCKTVYSIERILPLLQNAKICFEKLHLKNIICVHGDGFLGLAQYAPYDAIILTAAVDPVPKCLIEQLSDNGSILLPLGKQNESQQLQLLKKQGTNVIAQYFDHVIFVPMLKGIMK